VAPSADRASVYAVGALSGGFAAAAPYQMYDINTATKVTEREFDLSTNAWNIVGYCGLEYNLNDESSNVMIVTSMNAADGTLMSIGAPNLGRPANQQTGGWSIVEDLANGISTQYISADANGNLESSTCGISWNPDNTTGYAAQMFEPLTSTIAWPATGGTMTGTVPPGVGNSYHQTTQDRAKGLMYVTAENGVIDVFDISTPVTALVGTIDVRALAGSDTSNAHSIDLSPDNHDIAYVTSRNTPNNGANMELVMDVTDYTAATLKGSIGGFAPGVCGVYATSDKAAYYGTQPALSLSTTSTYWASYGDYEAGILSVDYSIGNSGSADASNVSIVGSISTNGVTSASALPMSAGDIAGLGSASITLQYNVPGDVGSFSTSTYATAQNGASIYSYPGPYPVP